VYYKEMCNKKDYSDTKSNLFNSNIQLKTPVSKNELKFEKRMYKKWILLAKPPFSVLKETN
jgi:hypothetical protein